MALRKKKGFAIESKTLRCKLQRAGIDLSETKAAFNQAVEFYFLVVNTHPEGIDCETPWRFYEKLTLNETSEYHFPFDCPSDIRRAAIRKAIGAYSSWRCNYARWKKRPKKHRHHRPPVQPRTFNFNPIFNSDVCKEDDQKTIILKIRRNNSWVWVKFSYQGYELPESEGWVKASPTVVVKDNGAWLNFTVERYVPATGGIAKVIQKKQLRICSVDIDLDQNIAIGSVLEFNDSGAVKEVARFFVKGYPAHTRRRKRRLGHIAVAMKKTGIICEGFSSRMWKKIHQCEVNEGYRVASEITKNVNHHGCKVIVFEHLGNLRPSKQKYSARSNHKRAYWLKSKIYLNTRRIAYQKHAIVTARVNPKDTSRLCAYDNTPVWRGSEFPQTLLDWAKPYECGGRLYATLTGHRGHSGLNAARNIGLKFLRRRFKSPTLVKEGFGKVERKVSPS